MASANPSLSDLLPLRRSATEVGRRGLCLLQRLENARSVAGFDQGLELGLEREGEVSAHGPGLGGSGLLHRCRRLLGEVVAQTVDEARHAGLLVELGVVSRDGQVVER